MTLYKKKVNTISIPYLTMFLSFLRSIKMNMTQSTLTIKDTINKVANTVTTALLLVLSAPSVGWTVNVVLQ